MVKHAVSLLVLLLWLPGSGCDRHETPGEKPSGTSAPKPAPATTGPPEKLIVQTPDGPRELPLAVRVRQLLVTPSTGPVTDALVRNLTDKVFEGTAKATWPAGWSVSPASHKLRIEPHKTQRLAWTINKATDAADNRYDVGIEITDADGTPVVTHKQTIQCASAPYGKPTIDGKFDDWKGAIPLTFVTRGKKTIVEMYWSKRKLSLRIGVEAHDMADRVQFAIAPVATATPRNAEEKAGRHEFLLVPHRTVEEGVLGAGLVRLISPHEPLSVAQKPRDTSTRQVVDADVIAVRDAETMWYELAIPMKQLAPIRPAPGRALAFSILVHDPEGTGLRDWGEAAGLWPWQRNRLAWSALPIAYRPEQPPFDSRIEFGFCSSAE